MIYLIYYVIILAKYYLILLLTNAMELLLLNGSFETSGDLEILSNLRLRFLVSFFKIYFLGVVLDNLGDV